MGNNLFGADIAGEIARGFVAAGAPAMVLSSISPGAATPGHLAAGTNPTTIDADCSGIVIEFDDYMIDGTTVRQGDLKIMIFGDTLPEDIVPKLHDTILAEGETYRIVGRVKRDPDAATYTCHVRGKSVS